jgi:phospholipase D1/2
MDDTDIGGPPVHLDATGKPAAKEFNPLTADIKVAHLDKDCMRDPLNDSFFEDTWRQIADNNTKIFRKVFRCNPDSEVTTWLEYRDFVAYAERLAQSQGAKSTEREEQEAAGKSGPPGASSTAAGMGAVPGLNNLVEKMTGHGQDDRPLGTVAEWAENAHEDNMQRQDTGREAEMNGHLDGIDEKAELRRAEEPASPVLPAGDETFPSLESTLLNTSTAGAEPTTQPADSTPAPRKTTFSTTATNSSNTNGAANKGSGKRRRRATTKNKFSGSDDLLSRQDAEELLSLVQGNLVFFPYDWLIREELNSNWLYQVDQVAPLQI